MLQRHKISFEQEPFFLKLTVTILLLMEKSLKTLLYLCSERKIRTVNSMAYVTLQDLRSVFQSYPDNLFVGGSLARGEQCVRDIDITIINRGIVSSGLPASYTSIPISYKSISLDEVPVYFGTCLRSTSFLLDHAVLHVPDTCSLKAVQEEKRKALTERSPFYLLTLELEERIAQRLYEFSSDHDYYTFKRKPGSKRTIGRIIWALKSMHPELVDVTNTGESLEIGYQHGFLPREIAKTAQQLLSSLTPTLGGIDVLAFDQQRSAIKNWWNTEFTVFLNEFVGERVDQTYQEQITAATLDTTDPHLLSALLHSAQNGSRKSYEQWLLIFALAANPYLGSSDFHVIASTYARNMSYRPILRALVRNQGASSEMLDAMDLSLDPYAQKYRERRLRGSQVFN